MVACRQSWLSQAMFLMADTQDIASWQMNVPAGALGNREDMTILPHQPVLIESDTAEEMTGDPLALIKWLLRISWIA